MRAISVELSSEDCSAQDIEVSSKSDCIAFAKTNINGKQASIETVYTAPPTEQDSVDKGTVTISVGGKVIGTIPYIAVASPKK